MKSKDKLIIELKEIVELVKLCPENVQEKCFELLFDYYVSNHDAEKTKISKGVEETDTKKHKEDDISDGDEIKLTDIHTKVKALLKNGDLNIADINNLFYKEGGEFKPLYDDLKTTIMADSQIRLALMGSLRNALSDGEFRISTDDVRDHCITLKCYDSSNFAAHFKKNKEYFNEDYKKGGILSLSSSGKRELIRIALEISR